MNDDEIHYTDLTVGSEHAFHMNGKDFGETWIITGVNLDGKDRMTINIQTKESCEKEIPSLHFTPWTPSPEELEEFRKDLESCRDVGTTILCPACLHPPKEHDFAGCNNINFFTEDHCGCFVPYGGQTGTPEK